ncbi:hypothetical protein ADIAL_2094 [Alkalibacterium sp. AK22]|nr:hypothetical protein ADIAL_2094 [Alkalibacterium sp. AK22]
MKISWTNWSGQFGLVELVNLDLDSINRRYLNYGCFILRSTVW